MVEYRLPMQQLRNLADRAAALVRKRKNHRSGKRCAPVDPACAVAQAPPPAAPRREPQALHPRRCTREARRPNDAAGGAQATGEGAQQTQGSRRVLAPRQRAPRAQDQQAHLAHPPRAVHGAIARYIETHYDVTYVLLPTLDTARLVRRDARSPLRARTKNDVRLWRRTATSAGTCTGAQAAPRRWRCTRSMRTSHPKPVPLLQLQPAPAGALLGVRLRELRLRRRSRPELCRVHPGEAHRAAAARIAARPRRPTTPMGTARPLREPPAIGPAHHVGRCTTLSRRDTIASPHEPRAGGEARRLPCTRSRTLQQKSSYIAEETTTCGSLILL